MSREPLVLAGLDVIKGSPAAAYARWREQRARTPHVRSWRPQLEVAVSLFCQPEVADAFTAEGVTDRLLSRNKLQSGPEDVPVPEDGERITL
ncbi:hypothetical protein [Haloterrigena salifodinae]|uniref:Uncharacterized protein n=1 Tax=Haloterrigena salifodinae TaxID=2675099 RepID=A0A8T8E8S0_9EURY|nr:hypothetical protein [Haloterrigena salifodinae]QRV17902.1 hypothetical protein JMJ58_23225 [Haloterrigena salifodinae]